MWKFSVCYLFYITLLEWRWTFPELHGFTLCTRVVSYQNQQTFRSYVLVLWKARDLYIVIIPVKRGYCFRFVCLSVRLSVRDAFFSFCARNSSYSFPHIQTKRIPSESCMSRVYHGEVCFSVPQNFGVIGLQKRPKITYSNFWSVTSQRVLGLEMRYPCHMKALLL